jgi:hypothetical protein
MRNNVSQMQMTVPGRSDLARTAWVCLLVCSSCGNPTETPTVREPNRPEAGPTIDAISPPPTSMAQPIWHADGNVRAGLQYNGSIAYVRQK